MTFIQSWRRFTFFDRDLVKDPENNDQPFLGLQDLDLVASASANGKILLAERNGVVYSVGPDWSIASFKGYKKELTHMCGCAKNSLLFTVGRDETGGILLLKVWHLDKIDKQGAPFCSRISKLQVGSRTVPVSALAVHPSLQCLAVGFTDSSLLLFKGDVTRDKSTGRPSLVRDGMLCAADGEVVGLGWHAPGAGGAGLPAVSSTAPSLTWPLTLFALTDRTMFSYTIMAKEESKQILDHHGCDNGCWSVGDDDLKNEFILVRSDAVYFYQPDCRGQCYVFEGEKSLVRTRGSYLVVVSKDASTPGTSDDTKMNMITIYDIPNFYIAYSAPIPEVLDVIFEFGCFNVISKNGKVYQLYEKDIHDKLQILFRKSLYDLALSLAKKTLHDETALAEIFKQYGDYLYKKNDFDNAVQQYIKTIGCLEASYVIRKFLDAQRINQLTTYLEALHKESLGTKDHTTILLNCYTKLSNSKKLEEFVKASGSGDVHFDVDTAIRALRNAGYADHAVHLARLHKRHEQVLHIQLELMQQYDQAMDYIKELQFDQAFEVMKLYGKVLLEHCPDATTALIKKLCTGYNDSGADLQKVNPDEFIDIFVNDPERLLEFLEYMISEDDECRPVLYNTILELYLKQYQNTSDSDKLKIEAKIIQFLQKHKDRYELDHALVSCQANSFFPGMVYIYERAELYHQILLHYMDIKDFDKIMETCQEYGKEEKHKDMWTEALWFFARTPDCPMHCVSELLRHIDQSNVLPPLMVLEILSHSTTVNLSVVKDYLLRWLKSENDHIVEDEAKIHQYRDEIKKTREIISDLQNNGQVFQVSRCSACDHQLEVPTVHFLCKHSYHKHCFESYAENESECPVCLPEYKKIRVQISAQGSSKDMYSEFTKELGSSMDTISTVASYFGRGLFSKMPELTPAGGSGQSKQSLSFSATKPKQPDRSEASLNPFDPPKWYES